MKNSLGENELKLSYGSAKLGEMPDAVKTEYVNGSLFRAYYYDDLGRLEEISMLTATGLADVNYTYKSDGNKTTSQVSRLSNEAGNFDYTYDNRGNIKTVSEGAYKTTYTYDNLDQLVREDNEKLGKSYKYEYSNGNIVSRKEYAFTTEALDTLIKTDTWTYGDSTWGDVLTKYNNVSTNATNGRITSLNGKTLTYSYLGLLATAGTTSFDYDTAGRRISKTTGGTTTYYYYAGDMLVGQKTGNNKIEFMFDANGDYYGFEYNDVLYYYVKNLQGDVIAVANSAGNILVRYYYDAWGRLISSTDTSGNGIGTINPIRYRSYYYDTETGFYYLKTRYYSPELCRFLSPDALIDNRSVNTQNLFAYCANNPVCNIDSNGCLWKEICNWVEQKATEFFSSASNVLGAVIDSIDASLSSLYAMVKSSIIKAEKPNNIGTGSWNKQVQNELSTLDDFAKGTSTVLNTLTVANVAFDVGCGIYDNINRNSTVEKIVADAGIDLVLSGGSALLAGLAGAKAGAVLGSVFPVYGNAIGACVGCAVGLGLYYIIDGTYYNGKTGREWLKEGGF